LSPVTEASIRYPAEFAPPVPPEGPPLVVPARKLGMLAIV
jgi:hypothetical protein